MEKTFEDFVVYEQEDGGKALLARIEEKRSPITGLPTPRPGMFIYLQSYDENCEHVEARQFAGKRVRVTVEIVE